MDQNTRRIVETIYHGEDEAIAYALTIPTSWATNPTSPVVTIKDAGGNDVTSTCTSGSASASGQVITTPIITGSAYRVRNSLSAGGIAKGEVYRLEVRFTPASGRELEAFGKLIGQE